MVSLLWIDETKKVPARRVVERLLGLKQSQNKQQQSVSHCFCK